MQTVILAYPGCILFEVMPAAALLDTHLPVRVATPSGTPVRDRSGVTVAADLAYEEVRVQAVGCLLVPGGNPDSIAGNGVARGIVREVATTGSIVAGVCAGVTVLGLAGVLGGRRIAHNYTADDVPASVRKHTDPLWEGTVFEASGVASDPPVITARPECHEAFAHAVAVACGIDPERPDPRVSNDASSQ